MPFIKNSYSKIFQNHGASCQGINNRYIEFSKALKKDNYPSNFLGMESIQWSVQVG